MNHLLLIDAGNSRIKWALAEPGGRAGAWTQQGAAAVPQAWSELQAIIQSAAPRRVLISNVAGPALQAELQQMLAQHAPQASVENFTSRAEHAGLRNGYRDPAQLGCDRFASAIGARSLFPQEALAVVTCGTATTIDLIDAHGVFVGGLILPGLQLMRSALASRTAQLPQVEHGPGLNPPWADNTPDAIAKGCLAAQAGAIELALRGWQASEAQGELRCLLSGGAAEQLAGVLGSRWQRCEQLVLLGLHVSALQSDPMLEKKE